MVFVLQQYKQAIKHRCESGTMALDMTQAGKARKPDPAGHAIAMRAFVTSRLVQIICCRTLSRSATPSNAYIKRLYQTPASNTSGHIQPIRHLPLSDPPVSARCIGRRSAPSHWGGHWRGGGRPADREGRIRASDGP
eukprot:7710-Chlamydomonas_euryale.AAC.2